MSDEPEPEQPDLTPMIIERVKELEPHVWARAEAEIKNQALVQTAMQLQEQVEELTASGADEQATGE